VIYRATEQWFIGMETPLDGTTFRQRALDEIKKVKWDPSWGEERISNMIATRPDWCISRQRIWGVPIAVFLCQKCHEPLRDPAVNKSIVELFAKESADAWYTHSAEQLLPQGTVCKNCDATDDFRKEMDILDVWFESGASWHAVLEAEPELRFPADLYTEGGDQHRGWFHSSLLSSVGIRDEAPYKYVATSGWTLDEQRRAFSKSLGNGVDPVKVMNELGGDIVRLWVASVDFREDVIASVPLMKRLAEEIYRKLRNTFRFLLANLDGFAPQSDAVAWEQMEALDQYMLARCAEVVGKVRAAYEAFEFHRAYHALNEFCNAELSAFYLDVLKDRLYTLAPKDTRRLSAQTAVWKIAEALIRLVAPVLSFTADEVWGYLPQAEGREASVHIAQFPAASDLAPEAEAAQLREDFGQLRSVRENGLKVLEAARASKAIGKALEAKLVLRVPETGIAPLLSKYERDLPELFGVSQVELQAINPALQATTVEAEFAKAEGDRCDRCWRYTMDVGNEGMYPTVCARCADALEKIGFAPYAAEQEAA
jgi:isoleucyl-tRNA synthetase